MKFLGKILKILDKKNTSKLLFDLMDKLSFKLSLRFKSMGSSLLIFFILKTKLFCLK